MTVTARNIIPSKVAENAQTTQYTATNVTTIIDKFTATNFTTAAATFSVNLVAPSTTAGTSNLIVYAKTIQPSETYTFPEIVGHILAPNGFISTLAGTASSLTIRASGREIS